MSQNLKTITLPSGKTAVIRPGKGRDLLAAQRVAHEPAAIIFGLMAALTTIDGNQLVLEDFLDMDLDDILEIQGGMGQKNALSLAPSTSSSSPTTPDGALENLEN